MLMGFCHCVEVEKSLLVTVVTRFAACFLCSSIIRYSCLNLVVALGMCMVSFPDPWYGTGISCTKGLRLRLVLAPSLRAISHSYGKEEYYIDGDWLKLARGSLFK